jgi:CubicO group peptidase (beta-lactamase class C family)
MNFKLSIYIFILIAGVSALLQSCEKEVQEHNIAHEIQMEMEVQNLPSITTCVIQNNAIVWSQSFGFSDVKNQTKATAETIYHIGSVSKLFIATAVMQLEEQGKLELENDINDYLPFAVRNHYFPESPITVKMLLTHCSSLVSGKTDQDVPGIWNYYEPDQAPLLDEWIPQFLIPGGVYYSPNIWQNNQPGTFENYSNIGSCLLAYAVEEITGLDFRDYCMENIFAPLKMYNTSYQYADLDSSKIAVLYQDNNQIHSPSDFRLYASGALKSTAQDMGRFLMAYLNKGELEGIRILEETTINKILKVQNNASGTCLLWNASIGNWFGHTGGLSMGASSIVEIHPESNTGYIIFCNKPTSSIYQGHEIYGLVKQKVNEYIR